MKKTIVSGALLLTLAVAGGMLGGYIMSSDSENAGMVKQTIAGIFEKEEDEKVLYVDLEPFLLNLDKVDDTSLPYLKIALSIGILGEENKALFESSLAEVRDVTLSYLRNKNEQTISEFQDGELVLKKELTERLNSIFSEYEPNMVDRIHVTDMVMQ